LVQRLNGEPSNKGRYDKGNAFTSRAILDWQTRTGIAWRSIAPGKPQQNAHAEGFIGRRRVECLNEMVCESLNHARRT
jgi:transposase InsO family protein